jgi:hypothetical protein
LEVFVQISRRFVIAAIIALAVSAGCAGKQYKSATPGVTAIGGMQVALGDGWYYVPTSETPEKLGLARVLSRDGLEHDRLVMIAGVKSGNAVFEQPGAAGLPVFQANMTSSEVADFVAESLQAVLWDGQSAVTASNAIERGFTGVPGFQFDIKADVTSTTKHRGMAGGYIDDDRVYVTIFLAESPQYYDRHKELAQAVIDSMVPRIPTIRRY